MQHRKRGSGLGTSTVYSMVCDSGTYMHVRPGWGRGCIRCYNVHASLYQNCNCLSISNRRSVDLETQISLYL